MFQFKSLLIGVSALTTAVLFAADPTVTWTLDKDVLSGAPGQTLPVQLTAAVPSGYHIYSTKSYKIGPQPTEFKIDDGPLSLAAAALADQKPKVVFDDGFGIEVEHFEGRVRFELPLRVKPDAGPGVHASTLRVAWQLCNDTACLFAEQRFVLRLNISHQAAVPPSVPDPVRPDPVQSVAAAAGGEPQPVVTLDELQQARQNGLLAYISLAALAGAGALLTPCVFPMIPITVSFFLKRKQGTRRRSVRDAGIYSLGIIFMFTAIGLLFALLLGASGINDFASNPWVNLAVASVFVLLALSLFGVYEIQLPAALLNKIDKSAGQGEGIVSVLLMGLLFSLTSFTCTVPIVGGLMVSATQGDWLWPVLGMLVFSTVFSAPFFLMALFPTALRALPRSGGWLNSVKVVMGLLEIAAALKFLSNADLVWRWHLLTRPVFLAIWVGLALLGMLYLLGHVRFAHDTPVRRVGGFRFVSATAFFSVALFLSGGLFGRDLGIIDSYVPPMFYPGAAQEDELFWHSDYDQALAEARSLNKPLFVDFTGYTCTNCRRMETGMFKRPEIVSALKDYVRVRLYTDGRKDEAEIQSSRRNQQLQQERYKTTALPFYALVSSTGKDIATFPGYTENVAEFAGFLLSAHLGASQTRLAQER